MKLWESLWQEVSFSFRHKEAEHLNLESVKNLDDELSYVAKIEPYCELCDYLTMNILWENNIFSLIRDTNDLWR